MPYYDEVLPTFSLTKEQLTAYLDWAETHADGAGWANDHETCPLVLAYQHAHPGTYVTVAVHSATVDGKIVNLKKWQYTFREQVDQLATSLTKRYTVSVREARRILASV